MSFARLDPGDSSYAPAPGMRLLTGYAVLFAASSVLLFGAFYYIFVRHLSEPDRRILRVQAEELASIYRQGGLELLKAELTKPDDEEQREELLVRVADRNGRTLLLYNPDNWKPAELSRLLRLQAPAAPRWYQLGPAQDEDALEAYALALDAGRVLQVGIDAEVRRDIVASIPMVFLVVAMVVLALALAVGAVMAYRALYPVRQLVHTVEAIIETGEVNRRVPASGMKGEFAVLVRLVNRMLDRIEALIVQMGRTLDDVAHDLRTPMTRLRGTTELALQHEPDLEEYRTALEDNLETSETVLTMLNAIMDIADASAGSIKLKREPIALPALLDGVVMAYYYTAEEKGVRLDVDLPGDLVLRVDRGRMRQAIANLLDNAVKYTPPGGTVRLAAGGQPDGIHIDVHDTGAGISPDDLPHIWERLYRADRSRSEKGLGLGLSLVKTIVEAHGGRVSVVSSPGQGSSFSIILPNGS